MSARPGSERVTVEVDPSRAPPPPAAPPPEPKPESEANPNDAQAQLTPLLVMSSHSIHLHGVPRRDYVDTCDDKIDWSETQNVTMVVSIVVQLAVLVFSIVALVIGLNRDEQPPEGLRTVAWLETAVQLVELTW